MEKAKTIAVVGNPNSGKTTLFNGLTGSNQRVGNWPGVTVEKKEGMIHVGGQEVTLVDLPGMYSLTTQSEDERVARDYITSGEPGLVINILDATNLERNLYLTIQLLEMRVPVLLVVNMVDLAIGKGITINLRQLEDRLGCPVVGISATRNKELQQVREAIAKAWWNRFVSEKQVEYPAAVEEVIASWSPKLSESSKYFGANERWTALKLLELDPWVTEKVVAANALPEGEIRAEIARLEEKLGETTDVVLADSRYTFIRKLTENLLQRAAVRETASDRIDRIVMHRLLGIPIFFVILYLMFWVTMNVGGSFIDFFDILFGTIFVDGFGYLLAITGIPQWLITILAGGIGAGV
jgi:ferrous iron transport protein B